MYMHFIYNVKVHEPRIWNRDAGKGWLNDWRGLAIALFISCIFVLVSLPPLPNYPSLAPVRKVEIET